MCKPLIYKCMCVLNIDPQVHEFIFYYFQTPIVHRLPHPIHTPTHLKKPTAGSAQFAIKYVNLYQQFGSNNLIGWKLQKGLASLFIQNDKC